MYQIELDLVKKAKQEYNETLAVPADEQEIKNLSETFYETFRLDVPEAYFEFLRQCNGFEFNGCIIYGSENILEIQLDYEFLTENYIIFAEYDIGWFCMEKSGGKYCELDKPSEEEVRSFDSLEEMIKYILSLSVTL